MAARRLLPAQASLEYLLIVGGAVVVGGVVLALLLSITSAGSGQANNMIANSLCAQQATLDGDTRCGGDSGVAIMGSKVYICDGTSPKCSASYIRAAFEGDSGGASPSGSPPVTGDPGDPDMLDRAGWQCFLDAAEERSSGPTACTARTDTTSRQIALLADTYGYAIYNCGGTYPDCTAAFTLAYSDSSNYSRAVALCASMPALSGSCRGPTNGNAVLLAAGGNYDFYSCIGSSSNCGAKFKMRASSSANAIVAECGPGCDVDPAYYDAPGNYCQGYDVGMYTCKNDGYGCSASFYSQCG
ncbi:Uncharacterised protein [uncultured archaeon]|nr:Uncharacterised protein [uncultured archaeon]